MALVGYNDVDEDTVTSYNQDEPFTNLVHFVDVASSRIRQALDRPRRCRRRVNHRRYLARILSGVDVSGSVWNNHTADLRGDTESPSKSAINQSDHQSKARPLQSVGRYPKVRTTKSAVGDGSKSFAAAVRERYDHISTEKLTSLSELDNDTAVTGYELLETVQTRCGRPRCGRPAVSRSSFRVNEPVTTVPADVSQRQPDWVTSSVNYYEPHHSWSLHPAPVCLQQQLQQLSPSELAAGSSWYQTGFHQLSQCPSFAGMHHIDTEYCGDYASSQYLFVNQQLFNVPCSSAYQQVPSSACDVSEWLNDVPSSSWRHEHNNECPSYSTARSVISPCAYNWRTDADNQNDYVTNLQHQQSITSEFHLPYSTGTPTATNYLFQTPTTDRYLNDWKTGRGENHFVDTLPSNFNDSGLGSISFGSAIDIDGSSPTDSLFLSSSNRDVFHLQPAETYRDSIFVQTVL